MSNGNQSNSTVITDSGSRKEVKNLVDVISEIQNFSVGEMANGSDINKNYFTWQMNIEFFAVGFKAFIAGLILCLPLIPLSVAVSYELINVYGGVANLYDKIFMFILAFSISSGSLIILLTASKYVCGNITYQMAKSLYTGAIASILFKGILLFIIFQLIAALFTPQFLITYFKEILLLFPEDSVFRGITIYDTSSIIVSKLKPVFRVSSVLVFLFSILTTIILSVTWIKMRKKYLKGKNLQEYIEHGAV